MIRVVIDPGHGGENLGADYNGLLEKDLNLIVAKALREELEQYEGIEVYLTREKDAELSLADRVSFAKEKGADFLYSLHFNMSENHTLFGSEVWISAFGEEYAKGYDFANLCLNEIDSLGIYRRGIKTRLNKKGTDYYGIIRIAKEENLPCCIIEHCHLDRPEDEGNYETTEALERFGRLDATAIAKYYGLSSKELGVDYRSIRQNYTEVPTAVMGPDNTECSEASLEVLELKEGAEGVTALIKLHAQDEESWINYYTISIDGGKTFSELKAWRDTPLSEAKEKQIEVTVPYDKPLSFLACIYNGYDLETLTNLVQLEEIPNPNQKETQDETNQEELSMEELIPFPQSASEKEINAGVFLCIVFGTLFFSLILILGVTGLLFSKKKKKRKSKSKKRRRSE